MRAGQAAKHSFPAPQNIVVFSKFTTCVTSFQRPDKLRKCLESLHNDHSIVVATYGGTPEHRQIVSAAAPAATHFLTDKDYGCNRLWLQAVAMARTRWISLLHDDDLRPPGFGATVSKLCDLAEQYDAGFGTWYAKSYSWTKGTTALGWPGCFPKPGLHDSHLLMPNIVKPGRLAISPISFLYDRDTSLDILSWCEDHLKDCTTRKGMIIGNDIALTLGHVQRFRTIIQGDHYLSLCGFWDGSETCRWFKKENNLGPMYDKARAKLLDGVVFPPRRHKLAVHVTTTKTGGLGRRQKQARQTWQTAYGQIEEDYLVAPICVLAEELECTSKVINDPRGVPFVHDVINEARKLCRPDDLIIFSNDDICVLPEAFKVMLASAEKCGAAFAHRRDLVGPLLGPQTPEQVRAGHWHAGTDLIVMKARWWDEVGQKNLPDFVLGCWCWDWVMRDLIKFSTGTIGYKNLVYHERHDAWWQGKDQQYINPGNEHNRHLIIGWMTAHNFYKGEFEKHHLPFSLDKEPKGLDD